MADIPLPSESDRPWVDGLTIGQVLEQTAARRPDGEAMVFPGLGLRMTWRALEQETARAARALLAIGVRPGEHVALWALNRPEWVILQFATARIGAVLVNINPAYRPSELSYVLRQCDAATLFLTDRYRTSDYLAM